VKIKCVTVENGPGPSETVIAIKTSSGHDEEVVVHKSLTENNTVQVSRIGSDNERVLVELPRESVSGNWRIWIPQSVLAE
jgi:hypothetical protein